MIDMSPEGLHRRLLPYSEGTDTFHEISGDFQESVARGSVDGIRHVPSDPDGDFLNRFYNEAYDRPFDDDSAPAAHYTEASRNNAREILGQVRSMAGLTGVLRIHDVGCGSAAMVEGFQRLGMIASGNDADQRAVAAANPFCDNAISHRPLAEALGDLAGKPDMFLALHVFEHLIDPLDTFRTIKAHLSERGAVYVCVPNGHSMRTIVGGYRNDPAFHFPDTFQYFTAKAMIAMMRQAGLRPIALASRALSEWDRGIPTLPLQQVLRIPAEFMPHPISWHHAVLYNLLGYELFVLAVHAENTTAPAESDIDERADKACHAWTYSRALVNG